MLTLNGCQKSSVNPAPVNKSGVEVTVEDGGQFPQFLVGTWKADKDGWEFVFEPDGTISSAVIALGRFKITPGKITTVPMKMGGKSILEPGEWLVWYAPTTRELVIKIVVKHFYAEIGDDVLKGKVEYVFVGKISGNYSSWNATCTSFPEYAAYTPERHELPVDPDDTIKELLFTKPDKTN
ncbi:MAG: hypothetical protein KAI59_00760 [Planctomycetes bacterium]|nr:hypothetical protein [Planctomycetota bacterium]MCK5472534.1 hypothetical protein [Planctomycetota bacterium]